MSGLEAHESVRRLREGENPTAIERLIVEWGAVGWLKLAWADIIREVSGVRP